MEEPEPVKEPQLEKVRTVPRQEAAQQEEEEVKQPKSTKTSKSGFKRFIVIDSDETEVLEFAREH